MTAAIEPLVRLRYEPGVAADKNPSKDLMTVQARATDKSRSLFFYNYRKKAHERALLQELSSSLDDTSKFNLFLTELNDCYDTDMLLMICNKFQKDIQRKQSYKDYLIAKLASWAASEARFSEYVTKLLKVDESHVLNSGERAPEIQSHNRELAINKGMGILKTCLEEKKSFYAKIHYEQNLSRPLTTDASQLESYETPLAARKPSSLGICKEEAQDFLTDVQRPQARKIIEKDLASNGWLSKNKIFIEESKKIEQAIAAIDLFSWDTLTREQKFVGKIIDALLISQSEKTSIDARLSQRGETIKIWAGAYKFLNRKPFTFPRRELLILIRSNPLLYAEFKNAASIRKITLKAAFNDSIFGVNESDLFNKNDIFETIQKLSPGRLSVSQNNADTSLSAHQVGENASAAQTPYVEHNGQSVNQSAYFGFDDVYNSGTTLFCINPRKSVPPGGSETSGDPCETYVQDPSSIIEDRTKGSVKTQDPYIVDGAETAEAEVSSPRSNSGEHSDVELALGGSLPKDNSTSLGALAISPIKKCQQPHALDCFDEQEARFTFDFPHTEDAKAENPNGTPNFSILTDSRSLVDEERVDNPASDDPALEYKGDASVGSPLDDRRPHTSLTNTSLTNTSLKSAIRKATTPGSTPKRVEFFLDEKTTNPGLKSPPNSIDSRSRPNPSCSLGFPVLSPILDVRTGDTTPLGSSPASSSTTPVSTHSFTHQAVGISNISGSRASDALDGPSVARLHQADNSSALVGLVTSSIHDAANLDSETKSEAPRYITSLDKSTDAKSLISSAVSSANSFEAASIAHSFATGSNSSFFSKDSYVAGSAADSDLNNNSSESSVDSYVALSVADSAESDSNKISGLSSADSYDALSQADSNGDADSNDFENHQQNSGGSSYGNTLQDSPLGFRGRGLRSST